MENPSNASTPSGEVTNVQRNQPFKRGSIAGTVQAGFEFTSIRLRMLARGHFQMKTSNQSEQ